MGESHCETGWIKVTVRQDRREIEKERERERGNSEIEREREREREVGDLERPGEGGLTAERL